jgi:hypothetical protein
VSVIADGALSAGANGIAWDGAAAEKPARAKAEAIKMFRMKWPFDLQRGDS